MKRHKRMNKFAYIYIYICITLLLTGCGQTPQRTWPDPAVQLSPEQESYAQSNSQYAQREPFFMWYAQLNEEPVDVVFLGDSITQHVEWNEVFPSLRVANRGIGSDTTEGALARLDSVIALSPKIVSCMLGINDISAGRTTEEIADTYAQLLETLHSALPDTKVVVTSVLPVTASHPIDNADVVALNEALREVCDLDYVDFLDVYERFTDEDGNLKAEYAYDSVHPNPTGYTQWLIHLAPELEQ